MSSSNTNPHEGDPFTEIINKQNIVPSAEHIKAGAAHNNNNDVVNDNDIQVINRDPSILSTNAFSPDNFDPSAFMASPALTSSQLYSNFNAHDHQLSTEHHNNDSNESPHPLQQQHQHQQHQQNPSSQSHHPQSQPQHINRGPIMAHNGSAIPQTPAAPSPFPSKDEFGLTPNFSQFNDFVNTPNPPHKILSNHNNDTITNNNTTHSNNNNTNNNEPGYSFDTPFDLPDHHKNDVVSNQLTTLTNRPQPPTTVSLPPLPPLSESALPPNLNYQQLALPGLPKFPEYYPDGNGGDRKAITINNKNNTNNSKSGSASTATNTAAAAAAATAAASKKKKENTGPKTRPAFVMKIWSMVNDPANHDYIRWNDDGKTFQVFHREDFMKIILPKYFKHNNFASFVRQLNMYGWHKVQDIGNGTLSRDDKNDDEIWQFKNPNFQKDREDLLDNIIRNKATNQFDGHDLNQINLQLILGELDQIKLNQIAIGEDLRRVRKDNKTLWGENYITRERYQQQAQTLDKILKFLAAVYGNSNKALDTGAFELEGLNDINGGNQVAPYPPNSGGVGVNNNSNVSNPYHGYSPNPIRKPRLMLTNKAHRGSPSDSIDRTPPPDSSKSGTIEEIMRSYHESPTFNDNNNNPNGNANGKDSIAAANNVSRIYQQIVNQDSNNNTAVLSPRHHFPELNLPNTPYLPDQLASTPNPDDGISGLEQNIYKQGQSILQVQDWIQKLASQQQQQQQLLNERQQDTEVQKEEITKHGENNHGDFDAFDMSEFLDNHQNNVNDNSHANPNVTGPSSTTSGNGDPVVITPGSTNGSTPNANFYNSSNNRNNRYGDRGNKRTIEEIYDESSDQQSKPPSKNSRI